MTRKCIILGAVFVVVMACLYAGFLVGQCNPKQQEGGTWADLGDFDQPWFESAFFSDYIPSAFQKSLLDVAPIESKEAHQITLLLGRLLVGHEDASEIISSEEKGHVHNTSVRFTHDDQSWVVTTTVARENGVLERVEIDRPDSQAMFDGGWASILLYDALATPLDADAKHMAELRACEYVHILESELGFCHRIKSSYDEEMGQWTIHLTVGTAPATHFFGGRTVVLSKDAGLILFEH